jgi:hypothetical protein
MGISTVSLFPHPPRIDFRAHDIHCGCGQGRLKVLKTQTRTVLTLHIGKFHARHTVLICPGCQRTYRSQQLDTLVPPGSNFGYDILVWVGRALFLRHRNEREVVQELADRNIEISASEVSFLGRRFITYLALAHQQCTPRIQAGMRLQGGYVFHLDATTCRAGSPMLMSGLDSLSKIVLGNLKLPSEKESEIVPFLQDIQANFGVPLALVHDMGPGILKAVATVFPAVPDFICHFHFLRDLGNDFLAADYDIIRKRLRKHAISSKLRYRAQQLKCQLDQHPHLIDLLHAGLENQRLSDSSFEQLPVVNTYSLILWALEGKKQAHGYGFPFDRTHLAFARRLKQLPAQLDRLIHLRRPGHCNDNRPYFQLLGDLQTISREPVLWKTVSKIEKKIAVFDKLRQAMRIAPKTPGPGLNHDALNSNIRSIEQRVSRFRTWVTTRKAYPLDPEAQKLIAQIDKYWDKLFADPILVDTPHGKTRIQPQRTNNILERFFRDIKRAHRRRTGNASSTRMLQSMLAQTPLVQNLQNPDYVNILLDGHPSLEELFSHIDIATLRQELATAQQNPEKIPAKINRLIQLHQFPDKLLCALQNHPA